MYSTKNPRQSVLLEKVLSFTFSSFVHPSPCRQLDIQSLDDGYKSTFHWPYSTHTHLDTDRNNFVCLSILQWNGRDPETSSLVLLSSPSSSVLSSSSFEGGKSAVSRRRREGVLVAPNDLLVRERGGPITRSNGYQPRDR